MFLVLSFFNSKEAQKCFCESANCRGWIGGDPDKEDKDEERSRKGTKSVEKKDKKSKPKPKFSIVQELLEDQDVSHYFNFYSIRKLQFSF